MTGENVQAQPKMSKRAKRTERTAWLILTPFIIYYIIFSIIPLFMVVFFSFTKWNGIGMNFGKLTLDQYKQIFSTFEYVRILLNSLIMGGIVLICSIVFGFLFGYMISRPLKGMGVYRVIWYLPVVLSIAVMSMVMNTLIDPVDGAINIFIALLGGEKVMWQESTFWMFFWVIFLVVWKGLGGTVILFIAGFSSIPKEVLEAADLDGASGAVRMWKIIIPMMKNILVYVLVTSLTGIFGIFEPVQLISGGGPGGSTNVIMFEIYNQAFLNFDMGLSCALSVVVLVLTMGFSIMNVRMLDMKA